MKTRAVAASVILSSFFFSCKKQGAQETASSMSYELKTTNRTAAVNKTAFAGRTAAASIQWTSGTASATQIRFEAKTTGGETEFKQNVTQQVDLFGATSALGAITLPPGTYTAVEFKAFLTPTGNVPALVLNGTLSANGITTPLSFQVNQAVELKAEKAAVTVAAGTNYSALNSIDLAGLTQNLKETDLAAAVRTNGTIVLSKDSNTALYNILLANLNSHHGEAEIEHH